MEIVARFVYASEQLNISGTSQMEEQRRLKWKIFTPIFTRIFCILWSGKLIMHPPDACEETNI